MRVTGCLQKILGKHPSSITIGSAVCHEAIVRTTNSGATSRSPINRCYAQDDSGAVLWTGHLNMNEIIILDTRGPMQLLLRTV